MCYLWMACRGRSMLVVLLSMSARSAFTWLDPVSRAEEAQQIITVYLCRLSSCSWMPPSSQSCDSHSFRVSAVHVRLCTTDGDGLPCSDAMSTAALVADVGLHSGKSRLAKQQRHQCKATVQRRQQLTLSWRSGCWAASRLSHPAASQELGLSSAKRCLRWSWEKSWCSWHDQAAGLHGYSAAPSHACQ